MARTQKVSKACRWIAESLNEYAELIHERKPVPNHAPSSPAFWFDGLARETAAGWAGPNAAALLSPLAKARLRSLGVSVHA